MRKKIFALLTSSVILACTACSGSTGQSTAMTAATEAASAAETKASSAAETEAESETGTVSESETEAASVEETSAADAEGTHEVTDYKGNVVTVPNTLNRIVVLGPLPVPTVLTVFQEGRTDNIVGVTPDSVNGAKATIFSKYAPDFLDIPTEFYAGGELNMEELIKLEPDVVLYMNEAQKEPLEQAGLAAVAMAHPAQGGDASPLLTLQSWMDTMEDLFQKKSPAQDIIAYGEEVEAMIKERVAASPDPEPKKIMYINTYTDTTMTVAGKKSFGTYWAELFGGVNLGGMAKNSEINMEQVYEWDPDQIFLLTFNDKVPDDIYNNTVEGQDWSGITAVKNGQVFKYPFGMHRWWPPSTDTPLAMLWTAKQVRPDLFEDIDMNQEIKDYYKKFYDMELTDDDVEWILNPRPESRRMY